jgi:hypothetical protein
VSLSRPGRKRGAIAVALLCAALGARAHAQEPDPRKETILTRPGGSPAGVPATTVAVPSPVPVDNAPRAVTASGPAASRTRDSVGTTAWKGALAREVKAGQARVALAAGERVIHPGDVVGGDVIRSIAPGRILLARALADGNEATVVVTFDDAGRGRVRVLYGSDPTASTPPAVR